MTPTTSTPPSSTRPVPRYIFSGHAIGGGAHFRRLDGATGLNHLIPTQAASVLPPTGGLSQAEANNYSYHVDQPRPRTLFSVAKTTSSAAGRCLEDKYETEVQVDCDTVAVLEKLRIGHVTMHMLSTYTVGVDQPVVTTKGSRIEGLFLGNVEAKVDLDDEPLCACGHQDQLAVRYRGKDPAYRHQYAWRYATPAGAAEIAAHGPHYICSVVRGIQLTGPAAEMQAMSVDGYTITWKGFGKIILGEVHVKGNDRQLTMVRLAMGSDAGGSGSVGSGQSNGVVSGG